MNKISITLASITLLMYSNVSSAHSEHDKARFVANNGKDSGQCDNVLRPCKTIGYAVGQANKGDRVLVASGHYEISSSDELFYLKSALVPVLGGYNRFDHYQAQSPNSNITKLTNIPMEMTEQLRNQGFNVLADGKSLSTNKKLKTKLADYQKLSQQQQSTDCVNGKADAFSCDNIDLLAHIPLQSFSSRPSAGNDIWGHVDLNSGNEYAIMGVQNGIAIFNVTDPTAPTEVGTVPGGSTSWRDVKVYQYFDASTNLWKAYAYATSEGPRSGLPDYVTIIDLNNLPHSVATVDKSTVVATAHNVYISNVDHTLNIALPNQKASLQLVGANNMGGAFQSYSLENPEVLPAGTGSFFGNGYTHDGASLTIKDERAINDCQETDSACTVFIDFNETEMKLWNITDSENAEQLSSVEYFDVNRSSKYVHSGWGTENQQFILLHDEFDEQRANLNTTVRIFSIENLKAPVQVGQWTGPTRAIDHNGFVRGNRYYMSNYTRGLTVLDISDPANPKQVGFFDTFPTSDDANFNGAWGVYPYLPSGNIIVSDIDSGLYILKDNTKASSDDVISFTESEINVEQGTSLTVPVQRVNSSNAPQVAKVHYQVLSGSATQDVDYVLNDGELIWAANDNTPKNINLLINPDLTNEEAPETFFIRLYNPENNLTLGNHHYIKVNIAGVIDRGLANFETNSLLVSESQNTFTVNVNRLGSTAGDVSFNYHIVANEAQIGTDIEDSSGSIAWTNGESDPIPLTFTIINDNEPEANETFNITLSSVDNSKIGTNNSIVVTIADDDNNTAPTVTINENFEVNTRQSVTLTAQASDAENDEMTYLWTQTSGGSVVLSNASDLTTTFTAPSAAETLTFDFTATDFRGATSTSSVTVTVVAPPEVIVVTPPKSNNDGGGGSFGYAIFSLFLLLAFRQKNRV
ncbi:MAG: choice-of-anchor B family protein [Thalassotalea sp.]